jgi:hypothetical protein
MKSKLAQILLPFSRRWVATLAALVFGATGLIAQETGDGGSVVYNPTTTQIQGQLPFSQSYVLIVTSPVGSGNVTTSWQVSVNGKPTSVSDAVALGYVSFSSPTLTFTGGNQQRSVTVTMTVPEGAVAGAYGYQIKAVGWSGNPSNSGTSINSSVTEPPAGTPPAIVISTPVDGSVITSTGVFPMSVPFSYTATVPGLAPSPISSTSAELSSGSAVSLSQVSGLGTSVMSVAGSMTITGPGLHTLTARATNAGGSSTDTNSFTVVVVAPPPTVVINTPAPNSSYSYRLGAPATVVDYTFTATSNAGAVRTLVAKVDGAVTAFTPSGIDSPVATGTISLPYTTGGSHTLQVTTTDDVGTATANSNFTVNLIAPTPVIDITSPTEGQIFDIPSGQTTTSVNYRFVTTSNNGFFVDSVSANLGTNSIGGITTTGLGTASAISTGTLTGLSAGTYTLTATGVSAGINVSDSVRFTVRSSAVPPSVVINTPPAGSVYSRVSTGPALQIPLTFTGTSNTPGGVITQLRASLGTTQLAVTSTNLNTAVAQGAATMTVSNAGTYTISVTAIDAYGTASATRNFSVQVVQAVNICGDTFFDIDFDGSEDVGEFGLGGVTVKLFSSANALLDTKSSDNCGNYSFTNVAPGTYTVVATAPAGLKGTTTLSRSVTVATSTGSNSSCQSGSVLVPKFGFGLDFAALRPMTATGYTIGFWKNNLDKALSGKSGGTQVSAATLTSFTSKIGSFGLAPYDNISMKTASSTMGYSGSNAVSLLSKQLVASEYNYQNQAYINGNRTLTMLFIWWGEYIVANPAKYSSSYILFAKNWFDAYNNTHGGALNGPLAP